MATTNSDLIRRWFEEVWNRDNEGAIRELMAPDVVAHGLGPDFVGVENFLAFYHDFRDAFDSVQVTLDHIVESGDEVAYRGVARVKLKGEDTTHEMPGAGFTRYRDGLIIEGFNYWDFLGLVTKLGAVPEDLVPRTLAAARAR